MLRLGTGPWSWAAGSDRRHIRSLADAHAARCNARRHPAEVGDFPLAAEPPLVAALGSRVRGVPPCFVGKSTSSGPLGDHLAPFELLKAVRSVVIHDLADGTRCLFLPD